MRQWAATAAYVMLGGGLLVSLILHSPPTEPPLPGCIRQDDARERVTTENPRKGTDGHLDTTHR